MSTFEFDSSFLAFVAHADWVPQLDNGVAVLANQSGRGEIRYSVFTDDAGHFTIARVERSADPVTEAFSSDRQAVHRFLAAEIGGSMRDRSDYLLLWSTDPSRRAPQTGYRLQPLDDTSWFTLVAPDGDVPPIRLWEADAIRYSYVAHASLEDLYASFRHPEGQPSLHDAWLRWRARRALPG